MTDRFVELEEKIEKLERVIHGLEQRLRALDPDAQAAETDPASPGLLEPGRPAVALPAFLGFTGRTCLVLGGAFLIRAVTEANAVSPVAGAAAGLAYAGIWLFLADRDGRRGRAASASFHGVTAAGIAYPLLWETCARFHLFSPPASVAAVAATTAILLALSLRQPAGALAWTAVLGAVSTLFALIVSTGSIAPAAGSLTLLVAATIWIAEARGWNGPRWLAAIGADLAVLATAALAGKSLPFGVAASVALALPLVCVPALAVRPLLARRPIGAFEIVQSTASLLIGFGAPMSAARAAGTGIGFLGAAALGVGLAAYAGALRSVDGRGDASRNFHFFASLALLMLIAGGSMWLSFGALAFLWSTMALGASLLDARFHRGTLRWHVAIYVGAASGISGLAGFVSESFAGSPENAGRAMTAPALGAWAAAVVSCGVLAAFRPEEAGPRRAVPDLLVEIVALSGLGALFVRLFGAWTSGDPGRLAAVRTAVLATSAVAVALFGRRRRTPELAWLVYPLLALGGIKLLVEDVPRGRPLTLFAGFALFGAALLIAPRIARSGLRHPTSPG